MAAIRFSGMASGLPPNIVEQIMDAERIPVKQMEIKKAANEEKVKLVTDLETKISDINKNLAELVGTRGFMNNKLVSGDPSIIDGAVDPDTAVTGDWQVEVKQLAQKPGAVSNGYPDKDKTQIGVGYFKFETPEGVKQVYISGSNNTLEGVANQINSAGIGLRASVINDRKDKDAPFKLLVTGLNPGDDNQVQFPTVYMLDGDQDMYFEQSKKAQNAIIAVDGFEMELQENQANDVIPGITLDLRQAAPGRQVRISVREDMEVISGKIKSFVDAYNGVLGFIQSQAKLTKDKDGRERLGPLGGDSMIRSIEARLRRLAQNPQYGLESNITQLNQLGIEFTRNGTLNFNQEKFNKVLRSNPQGVAKFFRGDGFNIGFIPAVKREVGNILNSSFGPLANRKRGIQSQIDQVNQRIEMKERQLVKREESLRQKFADLESKMSKINAQGAAVGSMAGLVAGPKQGA